MSKIVIADAYKAQILEGGRAFLDTLDMRLYVVNVALSGTVMPASPSDECGDGGYAPVASPFPNVATNIGGVGRAVGIEPTYVFDHDAGDFSVYGVFFTDPANSDATVMAQARATPFLVEAAGQVFVVQARFDFDDIP